MKRCSAGSDFQRYCLFSLKNLINLNQDAYCIKSNKMLKYNCLFTVCLIILWNPFLPYII
jgi:hypothetical protein